MRAESRRHTELIANHLWIILTNPCRFHVAYSSPQPLANLTLEEDAMDKRTLGKSNLEGALPTARLQTSTR